jgi:hypothetical protein
MPQDRDDRLAIIETVNNWALWRDAGDWERFRTVWHEDGWMTATWFQGPAEKFIEVSKAGFDKGVSILHFLGGTSVDLKGERAIAQTKMTISQRAAVDGVAVDVVCTGRFYDFFEKRRNKWAGSPSTRKTAWTRLTRRRILRSMQRYWSASRRATATSPTCRPRSVSLSSSTCRN